MSGPDFRPLKILEALAKHEVEFIVIGGIASGLHAAPFVTVDLDVVPELRTSNLDRLAAALQDLKATLRDEAEPEGIAIDLDGKTLKRALPGFGFLRFSTQYGFLHLLYQPAGTQGFNDLARSAVEMDLERIRVRVASLADVIRSKQALGRPRDLEQLPTLRRLLEIQHEPEP
jgi:hypothetical protein